MSDDVTRRPAGATRPGPTPQPPTRADLDAVTEQLGRPVRGVRAVAHRCPCGQPDVVTTEPRLPDGTPFPTTYYVTCPRLAGSIGTLEAAGLMREMAERLEHDDALAARYAAAHRAYLADRESMGTVPEIDGVSAGGMPTRVKCLHALVGHSLAVGGGVNPFGDESLALLDPWWQGRSCAERATGGGSVPADGGGKGRS